MSAKHVDLARAFGALARLSIALDGRGVFAAWCRDTVTETPGSHAIYASNLGSVAPTSPMHAAVPPLGKDDRSSP